MTDVSRVSQLKNIANPDAWKEPDLAVSRCETKEVQCSKCLGKDNVRFVYPRFICEGCYQETIKPKAPEPIEIDKYSDWGGKH